MKKWTEKEIIEEGYEICNAKITNVELTMKDYGCMTLAMTLEGGGWGVVYGGICIGKGYVGADDDFFTGSAAGMEYLMRIMDTVGCENFNGMKGMYVRVVTQGWGDTVKIIGNVIKDKWFDAESFFKDKDKQGEKDES